jgi:hypothetical protein
VLPLNLAQTGAFVMAKTRARPDRLVAEGVNEYPCPAVMLWGGDPEIAT